MELAFISIVRLTVVVLCVGVISSCGAASPNEQPLPGRWYTQAQVDRGRTQFETHCAICHGDKAQGTADWRTTDASGNYPPPPLNGSAHAWHHPMDVLEQTIANGGVPLGGVMPGFAEVLSGDEARTTIAYFQNTWPNEIYVRWQKIDARR